MFLEDANCQELWIGNKEKNNPRTSVCPLDLQIGMQISQNLRNFYEMIFDYWFAAFTKPPVAAEIFVRFNVLLITPIELKEIGPIDIGNDCGRTHSQQSKECQSFTGKNTIGGDFY